MRCAEYVGRARAAGHREQCAREAKYEAYFLKKWVPLCQYHVREYYDLPSRRLRVRAS